MTDPVLLHTPGRDALNAWLEADRDNRTKTRIADALGVSASAVGQWSSGRAVPGHVYRRALRVLTGISEEAWVTREEADREQAALVGAAHAVGELPAAPQSSSDVATEVASTGTED